MKKTLTLAACAVALLSGGTALAVAKGGTLYIKTKNTNVYDKASATAKAGKVKLQPGDEVTWDGPDKKDPSFHHILGKVKGFVQQNTLSTTKPTGEVMTSDGKPMSSQAFLSSGAATKALTPAGVKYAEAKDIDTKLAATEVIYAEEYSKGAATTDAVNKHLKEQGLPGGGK